MTTTATSSASSKPEQQQNSGAQWHLQTGMRVSVGQRSVAGSKASNEDAIGIRLPDELLLTSKGAVAIIADGVSTAEAGKEASETCVHNFLSDYYSTPETWSVKKSTSRVLNALNRWLYSQGRQFNSAHKGYLSTLSVLICKSQHGHLFHVGDSRIYRLRDAHFEQLTRDHTTVVSAQQSYLARAMGLDVALDVDYQQIELQVGDVFLLSTDGLHDFVSDKQIQQQLSTLAADNAEHICAQLIALALRQHSDDNISCQLLRIDSLATKSVDELHQQLTELPFPPALRPGQAIDGLRVCRALHASNSSHLYQVEDIATGKQFCMKTPSVNYLDDPVYIERFVMETWIGNRLHNPHIVRVVENSRPKSHLYYLLELVPGITLEQWIKQHPQPPIQDIIKITEQIIKGVRAFHRKETLHQDLKPGNIMIDNNGQLKIIDFGSCYIAGIAEISTPLQRDLILGTADYSAPETVLNGRSTEQSDIFAIAVMLFEMLTATQPFNGKLSQCRSDKAYLSCQYVPSYHYNAMVPVWLDACIAKALHIDPHRRHGDVSELLHELQHPLQQKRYNKHNLTLRERDPERFWQSICLLLTLALVASLLH